MASSTKTSKIPKKESESLEMTVTEEKPEKFEDEVCIKSEFDTLCRELNMDTGKDREAFMTTLVESLAQMTTFISRNFFKLVELQFKVPISAEYPNQRLDLTNFLKVVI